MRQKLLARRAYHHRQFQIGKFAEPAEDERILLSALAEAELKMTAAVLLYSRHASTGRIHYSRVSPDILYNLVTPEPAEVLGKVVEAKNVGQALDSFEPPHAAYKALKAKLAQSGITPERLARLKAPAGLDLGAITPDEIAVSILAEIVAVRRRGQARKPASVA